MQWATIVLAFLGLMYTGYKDFSTGQLQNPLTTQQVSVQSRTPMPVMTWQVAFDPNTGKLYHLHRDGKWYEQPPQITPNQGQSQETVGTAYGAQSAQVWQRDSRQSPQASTNPWFR